MDDPEDVAKVSYILDSFRGLSTSLILTASGIDFANIKAKLPMGKENWHCLELSRFPHSDIEKIIQYFLDGEGFTIEPEAKDCLVMEMVSRAKDKKFKHLHDIHRNS